MRALPDFGPWRTIYGWYRQWAREGFWTRMLTMVLRKTRSWIRLVGGMHMVVHQCATNPAGGADKQAMGKTSGGRSTKIMALTDRRDLAVNLLLVEGQAYEGHHVLPSLGSPAGLCLVGDSDKLRQQLQQLGATHGIPHRARRGIQRKVSRKL